MCAKKLFSCPNLGLPEFYDVDTQPVPFRPLSRYDGKGALNSRCLFFFFFFFFFSSAATLLVVLVSANLVLVFFAHDDGRFRARPFYYALFYRALFSLLCKRLQRVSSFKKKTHIFRFQIERSGSKCPLSPFHFLDPQRERDPEKKQITTPTPTPTLLYTSLLSRDDDDKEEEY